MICVFKCPKCGSRMRFSPETQRLICDSCNSEMYANEYNEENITYEGVLYYGDGVRKVECPNCGSIQITEGNTAIVKCSYCDEEMAAIGMNSDDIMPEKIIPLSITERQAQDHVVGWWLKHESMPELNMQKMKMTFTDVYLPVWLYDIDTVSTVEAYVEHSLVDVNMDILSSNYKSRRDPNWGRSADDYNMFAAFRNNYNSKNFFTHMAMNDLQQYTSGSYVSPNEKTSASHVLKVVESSFQKIPYLATGHFSANRFHGIEPYNYYGLRNFKTSYLSGHNAENYEFKHDELLPHALRQIKKYGLSQCYTHVAGTVAGGEIKEIENEKCETFPENVYYALVPMWVCTYWYAGKKHYLYINGQTGKTDGEVIFAKGKFEANVLLYSLVTFLAWGMASIALNSLLFDFAILIPLGIVWGIVFYEKYGYLFSNKIAKLNDNALKIKMETPINLKQTVITRCVVAAVMLLVFLITLAGIKVPDLYTIITSLICGFVISISSIIKFAVKRKKEMTCKEEVDYKDYIVEAGSRVLVSSRY